MAEDSRKLFGVSFIRALIPFMGALPSWPNHLPKAPPPNTMPLGVRISTYEFWGDTHIQSLAGWLPPLLFSPPKWWRYPSCPRNPVINPPPSTIPSQGVCDPFSTPSRDLVTAIRVFTQWGFLSRRPCGMSQWAYLARPWLLRWRRGTCMAGGTGRPGRNAKDTDRPCSLRKAALGMWSWPAPHRLTLLENANSPSNRTQGRKQKPHNEGKGTLTASGRWWQMWLAP